MPWLFCPRPQPDELLSSWLHRLALINRRADHVLCKFMFGDVAVWTRDVDRHFPAHLIPTLAEWTRVPEERIAHTMLAPYAGRLTESVRLRGVAPWILPLGVYHRIRRRPGLQYCAACLRSEPPYARRAWRLSPVTVCPKHLNVLRDGCPRCGLPFMFHRLRPTLSGLCACPRCGFDLTWDLREVPASPRVLRLQTLILRGLHVGHVRLAGEHVEVLPFMSGLRYLVYSLTKRRLGGLGLPRRTVDALEPMPGGKVEFDFQSVEVRHALMRQLATWIDTWPCGFIQAMDAHLRQPSVMRCDRERPPEWLQKTIDQLQPRLPHDHRR
jgi:hypothetical protein